MTEHKRRTSTSARRHGRPASRERTPRPDSPGPGCSPGSSWSLLIFVTLFPFYWMLRTAFSNNTRSCPTPALLPVDFTWGAFKRVLGLSHPRGGPGQGGSGASVDFWLYLRNSVIVSTVITVGQVFFSAMAAYAFARLRWPGRDMVFALFLAALMVPPIFTRAAELPADQGSRPAEHLHRIILPFFFMTPFAIFFLRQFFLGISREVEEAAMIDGAGHLRIFFR